MLKKKIVLVCGVIFFIVFVFGLNFEFLYDN